MDRLMAMRIKRSDGTYSEEIPIGALISNIVFQDGETLEHYLNTLEKEIDKKTASSLVGEAIVGISKVGEENNKNNVFWINDQGNSLDKTFKQIKEAYDQGIPCIIKSEDDNYDERMIIALSHYNSKYQVYFLLNSQIFCYSTDNENDDPSVLSV